MLLKYKYRDISGKTLGWFQCDCADFKQLWHNKVFRNGLMWCKVDTGNKKIEMWAYGKWFKIDRNAPKMENPF